MAETFKYREIGARIRAVRKSVGITALELSKRCGLCFSFISHWETGRTKPRSYQTEKLAKVLGVSPVDLVTNDERESFGREPEVHGLYGTPTWKSWDGAKQRCHNPNDHNYQRYGARGIVVCDRWKESFTRFVEDMGQRPRHLSLDRIDVNGNYEPGNCRWATLKEQANNRRDNRRVTYNGETMNASEWAARLGISSALFRYRLGAGWPMTEVMNPIKDRSKRRV